MKNTTELPVNARVETYRYQRRIEEAKAWLGKAYLLATPARPVPALLRRQAE